MLAAAPRWRDMTALLKSLLLPRGLAILACYAVVLGLLVLAADIPLTAPLLALVAALAAPSVLLWAAIERLSQQRRAGEATLSERVDALGVARANADWALSGLHDKTEQSNRHINQLFGDVVSFDRWCRSLQERLEQVAAAQSDCLTAVRENADLVSNLHATIIEIGEAAVRIQSEIETQTEQQDQAVKKLTALLKLAEDNVAAIGANVEDALRASNQR
jgi:chromosome segregation ATPase